MVGVSTGWRNWQVMLNCLFFTFSLMMTMLPVLYLQKRIEGDMTFHTVSSLAANARVASLRGPPCHPDSYSGFPLSMPAPWFGGWSPLAHSPAALAYEG